MAIETVIETFPTLDFYISAVENKIGATVSEEHKKLVEKYETRQMESRRALSQLLVYESFRRVVTVASIVLSVLGCGLAILGFRWWYIRVQKPLDQILKKQAEKNEDSA